MQIQCLIFYFCRSIIQTRVMKQIIITALLSIIYIVGYAQIENGTIRLDELEIISSPNPVEFKQVSRVIHIITKDQIKHSPVVSMDDVLKIYGGVDIRSRGAMGVQSDINLRGGTFDQGLIMIDGISINDPQTGHHNLNQTIDLDDIDRIEIFEGPGARWFGANSFSGGINIISNKPENNSMMVSLHGGQYGYFGGKLIANYKLGMVNSRTSGSLRRSDGYIRNTDFNIVNINHSSYYTSKVGILSINLGVLDKGFGANSFYSPKYPNQYEHIRTYSACASWESGKKLKFKANTYWRRNLDRFELFREDNSWYKKQGELYVMENDTAGFPTPVGLYPYKGHNYHRTDIVGADGSISFNTNIGSTSVAFGLRSESIVSNVLGEPMDDTIFIANSDGFYNKSKQRTNANISVNQYYSIDNFSVSAGLSMYYSNDFGTYFSPGIDLGYFITHNLKIFASANQAIRLPTFTDLYYQGPTNTSNPNLVPERSLSSEVGIKYFENGFNVSLSGFYRIGKDVIDWIKYAPEEKWQSANLSNMNTYGVSVSANKQFSKGIFNYVGVKYTWLTSEKRNEDIISLYALDYLKHNFNFFVNHDIIKNLSSTLTTTIQHRNGSYIDYATGAETPYETVVLLNLKVLYILNNFEFSISGSNLLNKEYYDIGNVEQPGLWIIGGFKATIFKVK